MFLVKSTSNSLDDFQNNEQMTYVKHLNGK